MKSISIALIRLYQQAISPHLGPVCRYQPSCSNYAIEAINRFGALRGGWFAAKRLSRCHPWHAGGYDPVPEATEHPSPDLISTSIRIYNLFHVKQIAKADSSYEAQRRLTIADSAPQTSSHHPIAR